MSKKRKAGRKITLRGKKKKDISDKIKEIETVGEALKRGVKVETLAPIPHHDRLNKVNVAVTRQYHSDLRTAGEIE